MIIPDDLPTESAREPGWSRWGRWTFYACVAAIPLMIGGAAILHELSPASPPLEWREIALDSAAIPPPSPLGLTGGEPINPPSGFARLAIRSDGGVTDHCGGTVIAARLILSAAHCVEGDGVRAVIAYLEPRTLRGPYGAPPAAAIRALVPPMYEGAPGAYRQDVAVLEIAADWPAHAPPLARTAPAIGDRLTIRAMGFDAEGDPMVNAGLSGTVEALEVVVTAVTPGIIEARGVGGWIEGGDSGSGAWDAAGRLVGIVSHYSGDGDGRQAYLTPVYAFALPR